MENKRCSACGQPFQPHPQVPTQSYCSDAECQRERRRRWQQKKRHEDPDYRDNDARYRKRWVAAHADYWKQYRDAHLAYVQRNRVLQQERNRRLRAPIANENASPSCLTLPTGRYRLIRLGDNEIAKVDAWIVEITVLSATDEDSSACLQSEDVIGTAADN